MELRTLKDMPDLTGKKVIVRVDFNVPLDADGNVRNDKRIRFAMSTLKTLLDQGVSKLVLMTHVGRPKNNEENLKTGKIAAHFAELIGQKVAKVDDWGEGGLPDAKIVMLENLRFHPGEKSKVEAERDAFGKQLASLADYYVNEAFSNSHRSHASMTSVPRFIPGFAGLGVENEVAQISKALVAPAHPFVAVIGGLKADKLTAIDFLSGIADNVLVAGALAFSLLKAKGYDVGSSKVDDEGMAEADELVKKIIANPKVDLPMDAVIADAFDARANVETVGADKIQGAWMALDIGPRSAESYAEIIRGAKTVLWFGPVGVFEMEPFSHGTRAIGDAMAAATGLKIVGGGDSAAAVEKMGLQDKMTLVSTGGGASLEMIEGKALPGIEILKK